MSLDVMLTCGCCGSSVHEGNITHNLGNMAKAAGIYSELWRPDEIGITKAAQLIAPLTKGLALLRETPDMFTAYNPENGWGSYEGLVQFVANYLAAAEQRPEATVSVWR